MLKVIINDPRLLPNRSPAASALSLKLRQVTLSVVSFLIRILIDIVSLKNKVF